MTTSQMDKLKNLTPAQRVALMKRLKAGAKQAPSAANRIPKQAGDRRVFPLSLAQERLWFVEQMGATGHAYTLQDSVILAGNLDEARLREGLSLLMDRHALLRTAFTTQDDQPVQVIQDTCEPSLSIHTFSEHSDAGQAQELQQWTAELLAQPFELSRAPLFRCFAVALGPDAHYCGFFFHHLVFDGWSAGIFQRDFREIMAAVSAGTQPMLKPLPIQYGDFAVWQRQHMTGTRLQAELDYWLKRIGTHPETLELPYDRPRPAVMSIRGARFCFWLPEQVGQRVHQSAKMHGTTPFVILLAGFQALLHRYSGQQRILIGSAHANRTQPEIRDLLGFFVNSLVYDADFTEPLNFAQLVDQLKHTAQQAQKHGNLPFEKLVEALALPRDLGRHPVFQVMFSHEKDAEADDLHQATVSDLEALPAKFDLTLTALEKTAGFQCFFEFNRDLLDDESALAMAEAYQFLLGQLLAREQTLIHDLPLIECHRIQTPRTIDGPAAGDYPREETIHGLFAKVAAASPNAPAVVEAGEHGRSLTYAQLDAEANQLAARLRGQGVKPAQAVAVCLPRSADLIVALLAILKSGGIYVPLDPKYPRSRPQRMVDECGAEVLVCHRELVLDVTIAARCELGVPDDRTDLNLTANAECHLDFEPEASHPLAGAYINYTSGSTGHPKGVLLPHRGVIRLVRNNGLAAIGPRDCMFCYAPVTFDAATFEIWGALLNGARLIVAPAVPLGLEELGHLIHHHAVSILFLTTSLFRELVAAQPEQLTGLRQLISGGEAMHQGSWRAFRRHCPNVRLVNAYGPTENTVISTAFSADNEIDQLADSSESIPIGAIISHSDARVLDGQLLPVPTGVFGELFVAGDGLARAYVAKPSLTAERFVPAPFGPAGTRMYRTGDRVRQTRDGLLQFVGRLDHQVKIRGHRIEPGEIERQLNALAPVVESAVVPQRLPNGEWCLPAFVVATDHTSDHSVVQHAIAADLAAILPAYMMPDQLILLDQLPQNRHGKTDRQALANHPLAATHTKAVYEPAANDREQAIISLWQELLGLETIGRNDHFFQIGGHSLLATRVLTRLRRDFDTHLELRVLFEATTPRSLALALAQLSTSGSPAVTEHLPHADRTQPLPLSFAQQRLWFLNQMERQQGVYNVPGSFVFEGEVAHLGLAHALIHLVRRHEVLRTRYRDGEAGPQQIIDENPAIIMPVIDLAGLASQEARQVEVDLIQRHSQLAFDLEADLPIKVALVSGQNGESRVLANLHHIATDAASFDIFNLEWQALYESWLTGKPVQLPQLSHQYADYAAWQRRQLDDDTMSTLLDYWHQQLAAPLPKLQLPWDRPRPPAQTFSGDYVAFSIDADTTRGLNQLAHDHQATLFMASLAAYFAFLQRYSGQSDLVIGTPITHRDREELEPLIGFFVNTLAIRVHTQSTSSFETLMGEVSRTTLNAFDHRNAPFEKLVETLNPERDLSTSPIFQTLFVFLDQDGQELMADPQALAGDAVFSKFDLSLYLRHGATGLSAGFEFNTDLFDRATVVRMAQHFERLVKAMVAKPATAIGRLQMLAQTEEHQLLQETPAIDRASVSWQPLPILIDAWAKAAPQATAVMMGEERLSYQAFAEAADQLALRLSGSIENELIGVHLPRSLHMAVAVYAVLKAGHACVPLDPNYPADRLERIIHESGLTKVIAFPDALPTCFTDLDIIDPSSGESHPQEPGQHTSPKPAAIQPEHLAYVLFTSGSTGRPKGVAMSHGAFANLIGWQQRHSEMGLNHVTLQFASLNFDVSFQELLATWTTGGCLALVDDETRRDPEALFDLLESQRVQRLFLPYVALNQLAEVAHQRDRRPAQLSEVKTAGEALRVTPALRWLFATDGLSLTNQYGPTETHVASEYALPSSTETWPVLPPIGQAVEQTQLRVLDQLAGLVPIGVSGELFIGGANVARGYLNQPRLTAERFVPDPFCSQTNQRGARLYRTGDLVRRLTDGHLEFLGRLDHQVKIRGHRVECGDIESALNQHPDLREVAVIPKPDPRGHLRLIAFVQFQAEVPEDHASLRTFCSQHLPEYMVPAHFVSLQQLPTNPNGKIDRRVLATLDLPELTTSSQRAPRNPTEELLVTLWATLLGMESVGIDDHFFENGGHSLLATQAISRIAKTFGVKLPVAALFEHPTPAQCAALLDNTSLAGNLEEDILPVTDNSPAPMSFAQRRLWLVDRLEPSSARYNMPHLIPLEGELDVTALSLAMQDLVARHDILRTRFPSPTNEGHDGETVTAIQEPKQMVDPKSSLTLKVVDLTDQEDSQAQNALNALVEQETMRGFDLATGPLLRAWLIQVSPREAWLFLNMHHIISDGWSLTLMTDELQTCYQARLSSEAAPLEPLSIQYGDFAAWQRRVLRDERLTALLTYWRGQLGNQVPVLNLPTDRPRPAFQSYRGGFLPLEFGPDLSRQLLATGRALGITPFMTLLTGFFVLLRRYSGQDDFAVGIPIANRHHAATEKLIGFFVNNLVLRAQFSQNMPFQTLAEQVRATTLGAYDHQDMPFEILAEQLEPTRDAGRNPLFQVMFNFDTTAGPDTDRFLGTQSQSNIIAKFDLTLCLRQTQHGIAGGLEYNRDLFDEATVAQIGDQLLRLMAAATRSPDLPVDQLPLLDADDRHQQLNRWSRLDSKITASDSLVNRFETIAASQPEAIALTLPYHRSDNDTDQAGGSELSRNTLTYKALSRQSNQWAHALIEAGVCPGDFVGLACDRDLPLVVALLAILKTGAAYVPLDGAQPLERRRLIIDDAAPRVTLIQGRDNADLRDLELPTLDWEALVQRVEQMPDHLPVRSIRADQPAYVIYTSGSTGTPKGCILGHGQVLRLFDQTNHWFDFNDNDVWTLFHSFAFDFSVWEIWGPLLYGGRLVVVPYELSRTPAAFATLLQAERVTVLNQTPSAFGALAAAILSAPEMPLSLRTVIFGGEALEPSSLLPWFERYGDKQPTLVNMYGITETCVHVTYRPMSLSDAKQGKGSVIGQPIPDLGLLVLNRFLEPVPTGCPGELFVSGAGLAHGYHRRPALTAQRFVPDPHGQKPGARLYRSGDLARFDRAGELEYLGRADHQVKIRGFRIELGEIEAQLLRTTRVSEARVIVEHIQSGKVQEPNLIAYAVPVEPADTLEELRSTLKNHLPEYMIPRAVVPLNTLPLTANGKLDRAALPDFRDHLPLTADDYLAPRNQIEHRLISLFEELLSVDGIGIRQSFFELGGHSLLGVALVNQIEARFNAAIPLASLFQNDSVEKLAALVAQSDQPRLEKLDALVGLQTQGSQPALYWLHPVGGNIFNYLPMAAALGPDQPVYGLQSPALTGDVAPFDSIETAAAYYIDRIRAHQPHGPVYLAGWSSGGVLAYEMAQQMSRAGDQVPLLIMLDTFAPRALDPMLDWEVMASFFVDYYRADFQLDPAELKPYSFEENVARLARRAQQAGITITTDATRLGDLFAVFKADIRAFEQYHVQPYAGKLTLLRAQDSSEDIYRLDPYLGWRDHLRGDQLEIHQVSGDHFTVLKPHHAPSLATVIKRIIHGLDQAQY